MKKNINCLCTKIFSIEVDEEIDLDANKEALEKICNGTLFSFVCPLCGKKHKPEYNLKIIWKSKNAEYEVIPELQRFEYYHKKKEEKSPSSQMLIGYPELSDRITVIRDNLEPVIIETLKYYLLAKANEHYPDADINAWYHRKDTEAIEFHLEGIKDDEVAVMKVPMEVYEKTCKDYKNNPKGGVFPSLFHNAYLSVQNIYKPDYIK